MKPLGRKMRQRDTGCADENEVHDETSICDIEGCRRVIVFTESNFEAAIKIAVEEGRLVLGRRIAWDGYEEFIYPSFEQIWPELKKKLLEGE